MADEGKPRRGLPDTPWSLILKARDAREGVRRSALDGLAQYYWQPIYVFARHLGRSHPAAEDLTQEFFSHAFHYHLFDRADPNQRLRNLIIHSLKQLIGKENERKFAKKRGGGIPDIPIQELVLEPRSETRTPDVEFERRWARTLLDRATVALAKDYHARGRGELFEKLKPCLEGELDTPYKEMAIEMGVSESAVKQSVLRLRRRLREFLREIVRETVTNEDEVDEGNNLHSHRVESCLNLQTFLLVLTNVVAVETPFLLMPQRLSARLAQRTLC